MPFGLVSKIPIFLVGKRPYTQPARDVLVSPFTHVQYCTKVAQKEMQVIVSALSGEKNENGQRSKLYVLGL